MHLHVRPRVGRVLHWIVCVFTLWLSNFGFYNRTLNWNPCSFSVGKYPQGLTCNHSPYLHIPRSWISGTESEHQTSHDITQCLLVPLISFISGLLYWNIVREFLTQCAGQMSVLRQIVHILSTTQAYRIERFHSNGNSVLQGINHFIRGRVQERWKLVVGALCSRGNDEE